MPDQPAREARRQANFAQATAASPLPPSIADVPLPGGLRLADDEFVVRTAKDWGVATKPLVLTTRRLICPSDLAARAVAVIPLTDIRDVQLRKHYVGFPTIVVSVVNQPAASFPAHINGGRVRADIATMVEAAQRAAIPKLSLVEPPAGDRYERLRKIGELKASGILSEAEFEQEKARILKGS